MLNISYMYINILINTVEIRKYFKLKADYLFRLLSYCAQKIMCSNIYFKNNIFLSSASFSPNITEYIN